LPKHDAAGGNKTGARRLCMGKGRTHDKVERPKESPGHRHVVDAEHLPHRLE
jgi:hypothetical protein